MAGTTYSGVATVTADLTEATRLSKEATVKAQEASNIGGFGNLVGTAAQVAASEYSKASAEEKAQKNITDQGTAKQESTNALQDFRAQHSEQENEQFINAEVSGARADFENGLISEGTYKGKMAIFQNALGPQGRAAQSEIDAKVNSTMVRSMSADVLTGVNPNTEENKGVYFKAGGSNTGWRDVNIEAVETASSDLVVMADSPAALREVNAWRSEQVNNLRSDPNYKGKNADQVWTKHNQRYQGVYKAKLDQLNKQLDLKAAQAEKTFSATPNEYSTNKAERYGTNTKEFVNQTTTYQENYDDHIKTNEILRAGSPMEGYDDAALSTTKNGKKIKTEHVQAYQQQALTDGDLGGLIQSIGSNPEDSKAIGANISKQFKNFETEQEGVIKHQAYGQMLSQPNGPNALAQAQTPKAYKETRLAYEFYKNGFAISATNAREVAQQITVAQSLAPVTMTPSDKSYMFKQAANTGVERSEFVFMATNMMALGMDAVDATDMVSKMYEDRTVEMGDLKLLNKPAGLNIGDADTFKANINTQLKDVLNDPEAELSKYDIRATDDDPTTAIVHSKETGMPVGIINLTEASSVSLDADVLAKVSGDRTITQGITNIVEKVTNIYADAVEDPTGTLLNAVLQIPDINRQFMAEAKGGTSITEGTGEFMGVEPVGPAELFKGIGEGIDYLKEKGGQVVEYLTPDNLRNPAEAQQVQLLRQASQAEIASSIEQLDSMRTAIREDSQEFALPTIVDNDAYSTVLARLADNADILDASNMETERNPETGELRIILPISKKEQTKLNDFTPAQFISKVTPIAKTIADTLGGDVQTEWIVAMMRHETGNGSGSIFKMTNNLGSVKKSEDWKGETYAVDAWEVDAKGKSYNEPSEFKIYNTLEESSKDYVKTLNLPRYKKALKAKTKREFFQALKDGGYMTDPNYVKIMMGY